MGRKSAAIFVLGLFITRGPLAQSSPDLQDQIERKLEELRQTLIDIRRDIHRNPEVSGEEERTAALVADYLKELGLKVQTGVGGHGVVAWLEGASPGPLVAFRADMDAVRSNTEDPVDFRSVREGIRHICGHDIHTTIGLALAAGLTSVRDHLPGRVLFIFQPAEERATGAKAMLADKLFSETKPDAIFAYHTTPYEVGQMATSHNALMSRRDRLSIDITGNGDVVEAERRAREVVQSVSTLAPDAILNPVSSDFIAVGIGNSSGSKVTATLTTSGASATAQARKGIERGLSAIQLEGIEFALDYEEKWIAGVTNDPALVDRAVAQARALLGNEAVLLIDSLVPAFSEDFGSFQDHAPGVMFFLGVSNQAKGWVGMPHSPQYVADEEAIFVGTRTMAAILLDLLQNGL